MSARRPLGAPAVPLKTQILRLAVQKQMDAYAIARELQQPIDLIAAYYNAMAVEIQQQKQIWGKS